MEIRLGIIGIYFHILHDTVWDYVYIFMEYNKGSDKHQKSYVEWPLLRGEVIKFSFPCVGGNLYDRPTMHRIL